MKLATGFNELFYDPNAAQRESLMRQMNVFSFPIEMCALFFSATNKTQRFNERYVSVQRLCQENEVKADRGGCEHNFETLCENLDTGMAFWTS